MLRCVVYARRQRSGENVAMIAVNGSITSPLQPGPVPRAPRSSLGRPARGPWHTVTRRQNASGTIGSVVVEDARDPAGSLPCGKNRIP